MASLAPARKFAILELLGSKTSRRTLLLLEEEEDPLPPPPLFMTSTPTMVRECPWCWKYNGGTWPPPPPVRDLEELELNSEV